MEEGEGLGRARYGGTVLETERRHEACLVAWGMVE